MSRAILGAMFFIIFVIACFCFLSGCSKKSDLSQIVEDVLDEDQSVKIEITPGKKQ